MRAAPLLGLTALNLIGAGRDDEPRVPDSFQQGPLHVRRLGSDLALITGPGGNVLVAHDEAGALIVDTHWHTRCRG